MTANQRRLLFGFFVVVFILACPPIILYSRGYRLAFSPVRIIRTGTLAIRSYPRGAEIWVDGKNTGKTTPEAIGGLKADRYRVEVRKDGYVPWVKTLEVFPDIQTWASQIVLVPTRLPLQPLIQTKVMEFTLSPDGSTCAFRTSVNPGLLQVMKLEDGEGGPARPLADLTTLGEPARYELVDFQWSPESERLLFAARLARRWSEKSEARTYFVSDLESSTTSPLPLPTIAPGSAAKPETTQPPAPAEESQSAQPESSSTASSPPPASSHSPSPSPIGAATWIGSRSVVVFSHGALYQVRLPEGEIAPIAIPGTVLAYAVAGGDRIVYLSEQGPWLRRFLVSDGSHEDLMRIEESELGPPAGEPEEPSGTLTLLSRERVLVLMRNGLLLVLDPVDGSLHHVAEGVERTSVSPDGKKIAYATRFGLGVYYVDVTDTEPRKLPGTRVAITRSEGLITGLAWHRLSEHIFYAAGDTVLMAELDDRDERNIPTIASSSSALWGLDYDPKRDILYLKRGRSKDPEGVFAVKVSPEGIPLLPLP